MSEECDQIAYVFQRSGFRIVEFRDLPSLTDWRPSAHAHTRQRAAALATVQHGGLALTEMMLLPVVLVDLHPDIKAAMFAVRLRAADYILHATPAPELAARAAALHALLSAVASPGVITSPVEKLNLGTAAVAFDAHLRAIRKGDMWVPLSPIEWRLFELLLQKRGRLVSSNELTSSGLQRVNHTRMETSLLRLHISRLRAKLQQHFNDQFNIITLRGQGYMLE